MARPISRGRVYSSRRPTTAVELARQHVTCLTLDAHLDGLEARQELPKALQ